MDSQIVIQTVMASSPPMNIGVRASVVDRRNNVEVVRDVEREAARALGVKVDDVRSGAQRVHLRIVSVVDRGRVDAGWNTARKCTRSVEQVVVEIGRASCRERV